MSTSDELDKVRRGWVFEMTPSELAALRAEMSSATARKVARIRHLHGDGIAERVIDEVWHLMGRQPTPEEYREIAILLREASDFALNEATRAAAESGPTGTTGSAP